MPGLVCIIGSGAPASLERDLNLMVRSMQHEPFYSCGVYTNEALGLYAGWTCHRGAFCDCLPITSRSGNTVLLFYGEEFSSADAGNMDATALVERFEKHGIEQVRELNGWFQGVLADLRARRVFVFNDRYGVQRLNYWEGADTILFASEAKALLAVRPELRRIDERSMGEFLACDCVLGNRTLFKNVSILPGGSVWSFQGGELRGRDLYFRPEEWEQLPHVTKDEFYRQMEDRFPTVMARYSKSRLPVAVSLTGGLDTRLVMAHLRDAAASIPCYTFGGMHRESYDIKIARRVAMACGRKHEVLSLGRDFLKDFPRLSEGAVFLSDGCFSAGGAYELYLNRLAREVAPVRLTGNYGSEVFRAVRAVKATHPGREFVHPEIEPEVQAALNSFSEVRRCPALSFAVFRQAPWYGYARISVEQSQVVLRTPFMDNDLVRVMYQAPEAERSNRELQIRLIERGHRALATIPTDRALRGRSGPLASPWSYFVSWVLFKGDYYYKSGMPHWLEQIHYALGPFQPEKWVVGRHRFTYFRGWFRRELAGYVKEVLLDPTTGQRPYLNRRFVEQMVFRHLKGDRNYTDQIEKALTIEMIYRLFVDGASLPAASPVASAAADWRSTATRP